VVDSLALLIWCSRRATTENSARAAVELDAQAAHAPSARDRAAHGGDERVSDIARRLHMADLRPGSGSDGEEGCVAPPRRASATVFSILQELADTFPSRARDAQDLVHHCS
jgi:hypothetical protein